MGVVLYYLYSKMRRQFIFLFGKYTVFVRQSRAAGIGTHACHSAVDADNGAAAFFKLVVVALLCQLLLCVFGGVKGEIVVGSELHADIAVAYIHISAAVTG